MPFLEQKSLSCMVRWDVCSSTNNFIGILMLFFCSHGEKIFATYSKNDSPVIHPFSDLPTAQFLRTLSLIFLGILLYAYMIIGGANIPAVLQTINVVRHYFSSLLITLYTVFLPFRVNTFGAEKHCYLIAVKNSVRILQNLFGISFFYISAYFSKPNQKHLLFGWWNSVRSLKKFLNDALKTPHANVFVACCWEREFLFLIPPLGAIRCSKIVFLLLENLL